MKNLIKYLMTYFKKVPIKRGVFIIYFIVLLTFMLLLCSIFYISTTRMYTEKTNSAITSKLNEKNEQLTSTLNKSLNISYTLSNDAKIKNMIRGYKNKSDVQQLDIEHSLKSYLEPYFMNNIEISDISLILEGKHLSYNLNSCIIPIENVANAPWFKKIQGLSDALITDISVKEAKYNYEKPSKGNLTIFSTIYNDAKENIGYICLSVSKDFLYTNYLQNIKSHPNSAIFLVDNNNNLIIEDNVNAINTKIFSNVIDKITEGVDYNSADHQQHLIAYSKTNNQGWKIIEVANKNIIYSYLKSLTLFFVLIFLLFIFIALFSTKLISKMVTAPITQLSNHMSTLEKSSIDNKINNVYQNEIGTLINSYNIMLDKIDNLIKEAYLHSQLQRQAEIETLQTKIMALQSQINPHFLYNTLYSISWKAIDSGMPEIGVMLNNLSKLYKSNLYCENDTCTLDKEINQINLYINLQKDCFSRHFTYSINIPQNLLQYYMPRFILQPFIENIFIHAFKTPQDELAFKVSFSIDDFLHITIEDNGKGMEKTILDNYNNGKFSESSNGIRNVAQRIALICGTDYDIIFCDNQPTGTVVKIKLPIIETPTK